MKMIKPFLIFFIFLFTFMSIQPVYSDVRVRGYHRSDGTYVRPHYRTSPNRTMRDNYSTYGNRNPYTGQRGYKRCRGYGC